VDGFVIVANAFLKYGGHGAAFDQIAVIARNNRFVVIEGQTLEEAENVKSASSGKCG